MTNTTPDSSISCDTGMHNDVSAMSMPAVIRFEAGSTMIAQGDSVTISWNVNGASTCYIAIGGVVIAGGPVGCYTALILDTATFTLYAENACGTLTRNIIVDVMPVRIRSFTSTLLPEDQCPNESSAGVPVTTWEVEYASGLEIIRLDKRGDARTRYQGTPAHGETVQRGSLTEHDYSPNYNIAIRCTGKGGPITLSAQPVVPTGASAGGVTFCLASPVILIGPDEGNMLSLVMTNTSGAAMLLPGGAPVSEPSIGTTPAALYLTLGTLLDATAFGELEMTAPGWVSQYFDGPFSNWGLFPTADISLAPGASVAFTISNIVVEGQPRPGSLTVDYDNLGALDSDSWQITVLAQNPPQGLQDLELLVEFGYRSSVDITLPNTPPIQNTLTLSVSNPSPNDPIVPAGTPPGPSPPVFNLSFVYGDTPGYWALCTAGQGASIVVGLGDVPVDAWSITPNTEGQDPYWTLSPQAPEILGVGNNATVEFEISHIVTALAEGITLMYLQYANIPGYNDGFVTLPILKQIPDPEVVSFGVVAPAVDWGVPFTLAWVTVGSDFCYIVMGEESVVVPLTGTMSDSIEGSSKVYTLVCGTGNSGNPTLEDSRTIRVPVNPPRIVTFDVSASGVIAEAPVTVTWSTTSAATCTLLFNGNVVSTELSGTYTADIDTNSAFTLNLTGNGSVAMTLPVTVGTVTVLSFTTRRSQGVLTAIAWTVAYAESIQIIKRYARAGPFPQVIYDSGPLTTQITSGSIVPYLAANYYVVMYCTGYGGGTFYPTYIGSPQLLTEECVGVVPRTVLTGPATSGAAGGIELSVANADGQPVIFLGHGQTNTLSLVLTNTSGAALALPGGAPVEESSIGDSPAALYLAMGDLLDAAHFQSLRIDAPGWSVECFNTPVATWALSPNATVTLAPDESITFTVSNIIVGGDARPAHLTIDYYNLGSIPDDSVQLPLMVHNAPVGDRDLQITPEFATGATVYITPQGETPLFNTLDFDLFNLSPTTPIVPDGTPWGTVAPVFYLFFVYGDEPGYTALCTPTQAGVIEVSPAAQYADTWTVQPFDQGSAPYWALMPRSHEILGAGKAGIASFAIAQIATSLQIGPTLMYLQWANIPGYNDGYTALAITKEVEPPTIIKFGSSKAAVNWGDTFELSWKTSGGTFCFIKELGKSFNPDDSVTLTADVPLLFFTLFCGTGSPSNPSQETSITLQVTVNPPRIITFRASNTQIAEGDAVTITWAVASVSSCTLMAAGGMVGQGASGSYTVKVQDIMTFMLICEGTMEVTQSITVEVMPVQIQGFAASWSADPNGIPMFGTSNVNWQVAFASSIVITRLGFGDTGTIYNQENPALPVDSGESSNYGKATYADTFQITCTGKGGPLSALVVAVAG
jgi:hypothetical protein